jgi:hypothetical protein
VTAAVSNEQAPSPRKAILWTGRVVSALPALGLLSSAAMKLSHSPQVVAMFTNKLGYQESSLTGLAILEIACTLLYLIPQTAFLGALLLTGYLGGAIATHVRVGEPFGVPLVLGVLVWLGLYLRESRLKALAPLRT